MKVLIFGYSGTLGLGYGLREHERFPVVLASLLREQLPDDQLDLMTHDWGGLSPKRLPSVLAEIERQQPESLILEAAPTWIYFPLWTVSARRRLPARWRPLISSVNRFDTGFRRQIQRWPRVFHQYQAAMNAVARRVLGTEPTYTVPQIVDFFEQVLRVAKRREAMQIAVTYHQLVSAVHARHYPHARQRAAQLRTGLATICERHHATLVDYDPSGDRVPSNEMFMPDDLHLSGTVKRLQAEMLAGVILQSEHAYHE